MTTFREWIIEKLNLKEAMTGDDLVKIMQPMLGARSPDDFANRFYTMMNPTYKAALARTVQTSQTQQQRPTTQQQPMQTAPGMPAMSQPSAYGPTR